VIARERSFWARLVGDTKLVDRAEDVSEREEGVCACGEGHVCMEECAN